MAAMVTAANASLISNRSTWSMLQPAFSTTCAIAVEGAVVNHSGSWANVAWATILASGSSPRFCLAGSHQNHGGRTVGNFRGIGGGYRAVLFEGRSQGGDFPDVAAVWFFIFVKNVVLARMVTVTGTISSTKSPACTARWARSTDLTANSSWSTREKRGLSAHIHRRCPSSLVEGLCRPSQNMWSRTWSGPIRIPPLALGTGRERWSSIHAVGEDFLSCRP